MKTYIYSLNDPITNFPRYIGKANNPYKRFNQHMCITNNKTITHKINWIKKLKNNGLKPVLEIIDEINLDEWQFWEQFYITLYKSWGFNLTNDQLGGNGCGKMSLETKIKIGNANRISLKGKKLSITHKHNISKSNIGRIHSQSTIDKIRNSNLGKNNGNTFRCGKKHSNETKRKISISKYGNTNMLGKKHTDETKRKLSIIIIQYDLNMNFIKEWESGKLCAIELKLQPGHISSVCNGKRKQTGGYIFRFKNDIK